MEAKKHLRKPENWEDFESLCKKLWGEIWDCKEIKKNGRKGQSQNGVDVYGIPKGEKSYYGIQCKGKDEYSHKLLTKSEIDKEIDLAKSFKPALTKFYFATTANKDSKIEEYIRIRDFENRLQNLFEVHLFSWEDIVDLIDENKQTHDWYLNLNKFNTKSNAEICFENDQNELVKSIPFYEQYTHYQLGSKPTNIFDYTSFKSPIIRNPLIRGKNKSYCRFRLKIKNTGSAPIENPKIIINAKGEYTEIGDEYVDAIIKPANAKTDVEVNSLQGSLFICPHRNTLAPGEEYLSNTICIKPDFKGANIELIWKLVSNKYNKEGLLKININTYLVEKEINEYVDFKQDERIEKKIVDYIDDN
ncbi:hypothetical protein [Portibacter lacus]|uniref:Mrr-like domain-containing protein n=1 Tax=Portibacter lacus TaxID=1099794 RepID=A0AA37WDU3_9BACT|nr:hypothetical protein [Portibacter lacus]GLR16004.1 hypothetical protein GCM10007940_06190 [Portibacter lacus]